MNECQCDIIKNEFIKTNICAFPTDIFMIFHKVKIRECCLKSNYTEVDTNKFLHKSLYSCALCSETQNLLWKKIITMDENIKIQKYFLLCKECDFYFIYKLNRKNYDILTSIPCIYDCGQVIFNYHKNKMELFNKRVRCGTCKKQDKRNFQVVKKKLVYYLNDDIIELIRQYI